MKEKKNPETRKKRQKPPSSTISAKASQPKLPAKRSLVAAKVGSRTPPDKPTPKTNTLAKSPKKGPQKSKSLTIVGVGASAGGLEAFSQLLRNLPAKTGMAFVLVQHLDPKHESMLTKLLSRRAIIPVDEVTEGMAVQADRVYVMPPNTDMTISGGVLGLKPRTEVRGLHLPIDHFFQSLAEDQKENAIGVILSGTASDGALGLRAIKAEGGITFAQDEKSAKYGGMPHSAVVAGAVDLILTPEGIAEELVRISRHPYPRAYAPTRDTEAAETLEAEDSFPKNGSDLGKILELLGSSTGVNFTYYKPSTLNRRILRRMTICRMKDMKDYGRHLQGNPAELDALYHDVLINVTGFFRDPEVFQALKATVFPEITKDRGPHRPVRIWVPGCSTGEEVYSLAISLFEFLGKKARNVPVQIFATDLSEDAINKARSGRYPENIGKDLSPGRLERFFVKVDGSYQVSKSIREMCTFARHDLTRDPPFSNLDLLSCRNVLIYMGPLLQRRAMGAFHYSLKPTGFLLLGKSEAVGRLPDLFAPVDRKHRIYSKKAISTRLDLDLPGAMAGLKKIEGETGEARFDSKKEAERILLSKAPAGVIVDNRLQIIHFHGQTGLYLEPSPGDASFDLLKMAREDMRLALSTAVREARKQSAPVRNQGLQVKSNGQFRNVDLEVIPLKGPQTGEDNFLILFDDRTVRPLGEHGGREPASSQGKGVRTRKEKARQNADGAQLEQELETTKRHLQSIIEESDALSEEMRAANEEVLSSNEELQSVNEELETSKEELESANEELTTLNDELQNRNMTLDQLNNDMVNLLTSVSLPVIMLGRDLQIRRFTPLAERLLNITHVDIGRSILHIRLAIDVPGLETSIQEVINTGITKEQELQDREGVWYSMQIRPYRTLENRIDGAVLAWVDIDALKRSLEQIRESRDYAEAIVETVREPLIILDRDFHVKTANRSFYKTFQTTPEETEDCVFHELGHNEWDIPDLRRQLEEILSKNTSFEDLEIEHNSPALGRRTLQLNAQRIARKGDGMLMILLAMEDVTERKRIEEQLRTSRDELEVCVQERTHELRHAVTMLESEIERRGGLEVDLRQSEKQVRSFASQILTVQESERRRVAGELHDTVAGGLTALKYILEQAAMEGSLGHERSNQLVARIQTTIQDTRRIMAALRPSVLDDMGIVAALAWLSREFKETYPDITITREIELEEGQVPDTLKTPIFRITQEALNNVAKHSKADLVNLTLRKTGDQIQLMIQDNGQGFDAEEVFSRENTGNGFGLSTMTERAELSGGSYTIDPVKGKGTTITAAWKVADASLNQDHSQ